MQDSSHREADEVQKRIYGRCKRLMELYHGEKKA